MYSISPTRHPLPKTKTTIVKQCKTTKGKRGSGYSENEKVIGVGRFVCPAFLHLMFCEHSYVLVMVLGADDRLTSDTVIHQGLHHPGVKWSESRSFVPDSLWPRGLHSPLNSPGQNTGVGSLFLLQGIFPTQGLNPGLPHCRRILYQLSYQGSQMDYSFLSWKFRDSSLSGLLKPFILCFLIA